jgi:hypothetical protein
MTGPALLEQFEKAPDSQTLYGTDPATGRRRVTLLCGIYSAQGPQAFSIDFDLETKLPLAFTVWNNMERSGTPTFRAWKITFYERLPDSVFSVAYPENADRVEKELTIPENALGLLVDPGRGISAEGMDFEVASREILGRLYLAIIEEDLGQIRKSFSCALGLE